MNRGLFCLLNAAWIAALAGAATPAVAQDHRAVASVHVGGASLGNADSEMGKAPIYGGGIAFHLTPRIVVDVDVHRGGVTNVFGREQHDFTQTTFTGSVLFRSTPEARAHLIAGGGLGVQRVRNEFTLPDLGRFDTTDTVRLLHGRAGVEWDLSSRVMLRTEAVAWFGEGLDWVTGGRVGIGYRF